MLILEAIKIKKYYGDRLIFAFNELCIQSGEKIGIVGQNGAGKTTLLNLISSRKDNNYIVPKAVIGYFYQGSKI